MKSKNHFKPSKLIQLFVLLGCVSIALKAQNRAPVMQASADSLGASRDSGFVLIRPFIDFLFSDSVKRLNEEITDFHIYHPVYQNQIFNTTLGNLGTAAANLLLQPVSNSAFQSGFRLFDMYALTADNALIYNTRSPYTRLQYNIGANQEQYFRAVHTQNVRPWFNFGFNFHRLNSLATYLRQASDQTNGRIHASYERNKYQVATVVFVNSFFAQENGGLNKVGDSLYVNNLESNRRVYPVNLNSAQTRQFGNGVQLKHAYKLLQRFDSLTAKSSEIKVFQEFSHQFDRLSYADDAVWGPYYFNVLDSNQVTYSYFHYSTSLTNGLNGKHKLSNGVKLNWWTKFSNEQNKLYSSPELSNTLMDTVFRNDQLRYNLQIQKNADWLILFEGANFVSGFNSGNFNQRIAFTKGLKNFNFSVEGFSNRYNTSYINYRFASNYSVFSNDFLSITETGAMLGISTKKPAISVNYRFRNTSNWVYRLNDGLPRQLDEDLTVHQVFLKANFNVSKFFFTTNYSFQSVSDISILPLPAHQLRQNIYYERRISKNQIVQLGFDFWLMSGFQRLYYRPELFSFVNVENNANAVFMSDVYVNVLLRRARIFVKLDHWNQGLFSYDFRVLANQPLTDRGFRFGISWAFFD